jgi:hypothetical protein
MAAAAASSVGGQAATARCIPIRFPVAVGRDPTQGAGATMTRDPVRKWEFWSNGRRRSRTICVRLWADSELSIAQRGVGTDGCMRELNAFSCDVEHLPTLVRCLSRALAVASKHGLIKQPRK